VRRLDLTLLLFAFIAAEIKRLQAEVTSLEGELANDRKKLENETAKREEVERRLAEARSGQSPTELQAKLEEYQRLLDEKSAQVKRAGLYFFILVE
jgi:predicted Holliday junction resolvase-like endonuclease